MEFGLEWAQVGDSHNFTLPHLSSSFHSSVDHQPQQAGMPAQDTRNHLETGSLSEKLDARQLGHRTDEC